MEKKKLIEVALPLEVINNGCGQEKNPFLKGHPRSMHLWWARRPLAAARAVLFAQMIDDPSEHPEEFASIEEQDKERERLFKIIENICKWENINDEKIIEEARREIKKSWRKTCEEHQNDSDASFLFNPEFVPAVHDPFAGGGAIPLEAQRLGIDAYASDLNPVAVMINKAMIEIPSNFKTVAPVNPESRRLLHGEWDDAQGLVEDVRYYGNWIKEQASNKIGSLYPEVDIPTKLGGGKAKAIAWIWTRTVKCPNPACGCEMPLASTFDLSTRKGKEAFIEPVLDRINKKIKYTVKMEPGKSTYIAKLSRGAKFQCIMCGEATTDEYIKKSAIDGKMGMQMMAVVAEKKNGRLYLEPDDTQINAAFVDKPEEYPSEELPYDPRNIWCVNYGLDTYDKLYTNRQLVALMTFCNLVDDAKKQIKSDGGTEDYAQAISVYLAFGISQLSRYSSTLCGWNKTNENVAQVFGRQAIPMVWDFAEANTLEGSLNITSTIEWPASVIKVYGPNGEAKQADAQTQKISCNKIVSTDPPYYDNISYADLSDYFYVWLRRSLKNIYYDMFSTLLVPKSEELVATVYRHGGKVEAEHFFLDGMKSAMNRIALQAHPAFPITIYYAFKQSDVSDDNGVSSTGWETFLAAIIEAGLVLTGTWPIRTERTKGLKGNINALASSIVLVCRKRNEEASVYTRRNFIGILRREIRPALQKLQQSNIAPVDLAQSAIGPGMGVFSRFKQVLEADGSPMSVKSALQIINQELDIYFNEQVGELDSSSRFCVDLYMQFAFNDIRFGDADILARAKGTSVAIMQTHGVLYAKSGIVHLVERTELSKKVDQNEACIWMLTQQLTHAMEKGGVEACANIVFNMFGSNAERAKDLAYRLYNIAEQKKWTTEAYAYNALVVAWPDIQARAAALKNATTEQMSIFDLLGSENN